jgi:hypothetical protein
VSRSSTITGPLAALVAAAGGVGALADELGVSESTIWRWGTGEVVPPLIVRRTVNDWANNRGIAPPFEE